MGDLGHFHLGFAWRVEIRAAEGWERAEPLHSQTWVVSVGGSRKERTAVQWGVRASSLRASS